MLIDAPDFFSADFGVDRIDWSTDAPASINVSALSGSRAIGDNPWYSAMSAHVELSPVVGDANIRAVRSFLRRCRGQVNHFRLFADLGVQNTDAGVTVAAAASAGDRTLSLAGYATPLLDGQFATVNGQLLQLIADQALDAITFEPMLREDVAAGTSIETARPYALVYMASASNGYSLTAPALYGITFDVTEAIGESDG